MSKSIRNKKIKKSKPKNKSKKRKSGGAYYPYNTNPLRFTSSTTPRGGMPMDTRNTFFPSTLVTFGREIIHQITPTTLLGAYSGVHPDPTKGHLINKI
jgi:hypothetical protein